MKNLSRVILFVLIGFFVKADLNKTTVKDAIKQLELAMPIRVLLDEAPVSKLQWKITSSSAFLVYVPQTKTKTVFQASQLLITHKNGSFFINGRKQNADHLFILPFYCPITFKGNSFDGIFALTKVGDTACLVNHLDLEDYVLSVLPYESMPGWPDEVHKASCIAFRSYGIAKVLEKRASHAKRGKAVPYDIKNTNAHQVYKGRFKNSSFKKIVDETRGIVLAHKNKPILAMFDTCCGSVVPSRTKGVDFSRAPYLSRTYPCYFCKDCKLYRWTRTYSFGEIEKGLKKEFPTMGTLRDVTISSRDDAGVARAIKFRGSRQWFTMAASKFKSLFKDLRSLCFGFERLGSTLTIKGRGYGHHIGLCQWGAYHMAGKGFTYKNILKFYYPHTTFMQLKKM